MSGCAPSKNKKYTCGGTLQPAACTKYEGQLPQWSKLRGEGCVSVEEVLEEQYEVLDKILKSISTKALGRSCITYDSVDPGDLKVSEVLQAFETILCKK